MKAVGVDLGGTKIEAQLFDDAWAVADRKRVPTPKTYPELVEAIAGLIGWADKAAGDACPVGIGAAGLINPQTGLALTANLAASGHPLPTDIEAAVGRRILYLNDCRAMALSEAVFGAGRGHQTVMSLIIGTGVGGGIAIRDSILTGPTSTGGEFGHTAAAASVVDRHGLPVWTCGCGRTGCVETYIAGPGLERLALHLTGQTATVPEIAAARQGAMAQVWSIWCEMAAELLHSLTLTVDPDIILLGGGLSHIDGVVDDLTKAARAAQIEGFAEAKLALAEGGDTSGARGAAYAAWQEMHDD